MSIQSANRRRGFTLAEMLVVLVILALLTLVAVESLRPLAEQARFEATRKSMENIHRAIVGDVNDSSGAGVRGYLADTGQFPSSLQDLVVRPEGVAEYSVQTLPGGHQVGGGWRGPYLSVPYGAYDSTTNTVNPAAFFRDGWGDSLNWIPPDGPALFPQVACTPVEGRTTPPAMIVQRSEWHPEIEGTLFQVVDGGQQPPGGSAAWRVFVYGVGPAGTVVGMPPEGIAVNNVSGRFQLDPSDMAVTCGPRLIQATVDSGSGPVPNGAAQYVNLRGGDRHVINLKVVPPAEEPPMDP